MKRVFVIFGLLISIQIGSFAGEQSTEFRLDSLKRVLNQVMNDKDRVISLMDLGDAYENNNSDSALLYYRKAVEMLENMGPGVYTESYFWVFMYKAQVIYQIGIVLDGKGNYDQAMEHFLRAVEVYENLAEQCHEKRKFVVQEGLSDCYNYIGNALLNQSSNSFGTASRKEREKALEYYNKAINIAEQIDYKERIAGTYNNMGIVNNYLGNESGKPESTKFLQKAIDWYQKSNKLYKELGDTEGMATCAMNLGLVYKDLNEYPVAIDYYNIALQQIDTSSDKSSAAQLYCNLGTLNIILSDSAALSERQRIMYLNKAISYGLNGIRLGRESVSIPKINMNAEMLKDAFIKLGNNKEAIRYYDIYSATNDSMFSREKTNALAEMTSKYESERKQLLLDKMEKQKELDAKRIEAQEAQNKKQQTIIISALLGLIIVLVFAVILLRMFRHKKKANIMLAARNEEINLQKEEITAQRDQIMEQNTIVTAQKEEIEDSILYAKHIQKAILPSDELLKEVLGDYFIWFAPKDVVSGDFYWVAKTEKWSIIAVADCTGHGVPGAFMSMLGVSFLNEIVRKKEVTSPAAILGQLRDSVIESLGQTGASGSQKDGMDMSIMAISNNVAPNTDESKSYTRNAVWAGANNPVCIIRPADHANNTFEMIEIKGDKMPVAVHINMDDFTNHSFEVYQGDKIYLFTDGYADQFGGPMGKKFMYKAFKNALLENAGLPMAEQNNMLEKKLYEWMNHNGTIYEQVDDITVLGMKLAW